VVSSLFCAHPLPVAVDVAQLALAADKHDLKGSIVVEQEGVIGLSTSTYVASRRRGIFTTHLLDRLSLTTPRSQRLPLI
jgi:hypothetical protein